MFKTILNSYLTELSTNGDTRQGNVSRRLLQQQLIIYH